MKIELKDNFNLSQIEYSGQAFRIKAFNDKTYRFICKDQILYIREISKNNFEINVTKNKWENFWSHYFDLETNYKNISKAIPKDDSFLKEAYACAKGVRILNQDLFEIVITFIISQRRSIPAIKTCVEKISKKWGKQVKTNRETIFLFPTPKEMKSATISDLRECGVGYRAEYILNVVRLINNNELNLNELSKLESESLFEELKSLRGIGDKVANCIMLFGYHRLENAPVDTWINKVIMNHYHGENPFTNYGKYAGVMQQYMFYYIRIKK